MAINIIPYGPALKKAVFSDFTFSPVSADGMGGIVYDKQIHPEPDDFAFRDMTLETLSQNVGKNVIKVLLFFTPNRLEFDKLGFLYLEDKTVQAVKVEPNEELQAWEDYLCNEEFMRKKGPFNWLMIYSDKEVRRNGLSNIDKSEIHTETGKFLFEEAPKIFNLKQIEAEKRNYLKKYINTSVAYSDISETSRLYLTLIHTLGAIAKTPRNDVDNQYRVFSDLAGYEMPAELKTMYHISDGLTFTGGSHYYFLSINELIDIWQIWKKIYDEWLLEELKAHESDGGKTLPLYTTPYWIPFMTDGNGNQVAIDYAPGKKGKSGQIIVFGGDEEKIQVLAENLNVFLALYIAKDKSLEFYF